MRVDDGDDDPQCIGRPTLGVRVRLLASLNGDCDGGGGVPPNAAPRELLIVGVGLMRGYWTRGSDVDRNKSAFVNIDGVRRVFKILF